ncbi:MAG: ABC transporter substrate-binding protein [Chloroflexia bacterium]|nr:ABC transporter substrate-binding protein [Chloroflexia bacterium]
MRRKQASLTVRLPLAGVALVALSAVLVFAPAQAQSNQLVDISVALDWYPNANHAGLFLAQERGYFEAEGLDVTLTTPADPSTVLQTVGAGRDTFGISYQTDLLLAREQEIPVVSVAALVQHPLLAVMAREDQEINRPRDLVGTTVGMTGIPSQEAFLATMLEADGASLDEIELVNVGFDLVPAVISGRVSAVMGAYWTHETILAEREGFPVDILRVEAWGVPDYYELIMTASEETVAERPEEVEAFLRAMARGYLDAVAEPEAALDALMKANPELDRAVEAEGLALLIPLWTEGDAGFGAQTAERWDEFAAWMVERELIGAELEVDAAYRLYPPVGPVATPDS